MMRYIKLIILNLQCFRDALYLRIYLFRHLTSQEADALVFSLSPERLHHLVDIAMKSVRKDRGAV